MPENYKIDYKQLYDEIDKRFGLPSTKPLETPQKDISYQKALTFDTIDKIFGSPKSAKDKLLRAGYGILKTGEAMHGSLVKRLKSSKYPIVQTIGNVYDNWGVMGSYFFVNVLWDGTVAGVMNELNRIQGKRIRDANAESKYIIWGPHGPVDKMSVEEMKDAGYSEASINEVMKHNKDYFTDVAWGKDKENKLAQETPMGMWNSIKDAWVHADHAVTTLQRAGYNNWVSWSVGMAANILLDPFTYVSLPTTPLRMRKFLKMAINAGDIQQGVKHMVRSALKKAIRFDDAPIKADILFMQDKKGQYINKLTGDYVDSGTIKKVTENLKNLKFDNVRRIGAENAMFSAGQGFNYYWNKLFKMAKDLENASLLGDFENIRHAIDKGNLNSLVQSAQMMGRHVAEMEGIPKEYVKPMTALFKNIKEMAETRVVNTEMLYDTFYHLSPPAYQKFINTAADEYGIGYYYPEVMQQFDRFDDTFIKDGIKFANKTLLSYEQIYNTMKKTNFLKLKDKMRYSTLGKAFLPGAEYNLSAAQWEVTRWLHKTPGFLANVFQNPSKLPLAKLTTKQLKTLPYFAEGDAVRWFKIFNQEQLKKAPIQETLFEETKRAIVKKAKKEGIEVGDVTDEMRKLVEKQVTRKVSDAWIGSEIKLMLQDENFAEAIDVYRETMDKIYKVYTDSGFELNELKNYVSHIVAVSGKWKKAKGLGPFEWWFEKERKTFPKLADWAEAYYIKKTTDIPMVESAQDILDVYTGSVATALQRKSFIGYVFDEYGSSYEKMMKEFQGIPEGWKWQDTEFAKMFGSKHPRTKEWGAYFPSDWADILGYEKEYISLGTVGKEFAEWYNRYIKTPWSGLVTYRGLNFMGFSMRNLFSSTFQSVMLFGPRIFKKSTTQNALMLMWQDYPTAEFNQKAEKFIQNAFMTTDFGDKVPMSAVRTVGEILGVPGWGWSGKAAQSLVKRGVRFPMQEFNDIIAEKGWKGAMHLIPAYLWDYWGFHGSAVAKSVEDFARWQCFISGWQKWGDPLKAALMTKMFHFDYSELTSFERTYLTKGFAFYKFYRANYPLQFKNYFLRHNSWHWFYRFLQAPESLAELKYGRRDPRQEPEYFQWKYHMRLPIQFKGQPFYWQPDLMHLEIAKLPMAITKLMNYGKTDTERYLGAFLPVAERLYPWWKLPAELTFNVNFWRQRSIEYGKQGEDVAPGWLVPILTRNKYLRDATQFHWKYDARQKKQIPMMNASWAHFFVALPGSYQVGLMYDIPRYYGYLEKQKGLDELAMFTGLKFRSVDPAYYEGQYYKRMKSSYQEWKSRMKAKMLNRYVPLEELEQPTEFDDVFLQMYDAENMVNSDKEAIMTKIDEIFGKGK